MNTPHIHCDLIKLWADGNEIQCLVRDTALWLGDSEPTWDEHARYRIKPEPYEAWVNVFSDYIDLVFDTPELAELSTWTVRMQSLHALSSASSGVSNTRSI